MFERFTDRARRALVLAQEEARLVRHERIGTEHLLLGLVHEGEGVAARALDALGVTIDRARARVEEFGPASAHPMASPPFSAGAKRVMELALVEALQLGAAWIGTEHLLLGIVREGEGTAMRVLAGFDLTGLQVRQEVLRHLSDGAEGTAVRPTRPPVSLRAASLRRADAPRGALGRTAPRHCSFCGRDLWDVERFVATEHAAICAPCVTMAVYAAEHGEAERDGEVPFPPRVFGEAPDDGAVDAIVAAFRSTFGPRPTGAQDGTGDPLAPSLTRLGGRLGRVRPPRVRRVRFTGDGEAECDVVVRFDPEPALEVVGRAVRAGDRWEVSWATVAEVLTRLGVDRPDEPS